MASIGYVRTLLNQLEDKVKKALEPAFEHAMTDNIIGTATKAANFRWVKLSSTTHGTANTEFTLAHGLGVVPTNVIPFLDVSLVGSQMVPLTVSQAPDVMRLYFKSSSTGAVFSVLVEY